MASENKLLLMSCQRATELVEKSNFVELSKSEKVKLTIHLSICSTCKDYKDQSGYIDQLLSTVNQEEKKLTTEEKSDLLSYLLKNKK